MDLTVPVHCDPPQTQSIPYQTPVSIPFCPNQHSPAYMRANSHATSPMDTGPGQMINHFSPSHSIHSSPHSVHSPLNHSNVPSLPSFPSAQTIPQSVSETWHHHIVPTFQNLTHNFTPQDLFNYHPLPPAPASNNFLPESYTPIGSPQFLPMNYIRSPVSVPPASVCLPSRLGSCMANHPAVKRTPSCIMHQPHPHHIVDLDHISASAQLVPETQSAPAILSEFPWDHYHHIPELNHQCLPDNSPTKQPRSVTPKFKIEYSSIHTTFLATIKDADSLKDRKLWVKWNEGVWQAVADGFVLGHICDKPLPGTPWTEWNMPLLRPTISPNPMRKELETRLKWDNSSILTARLLDEARNHLPPMINDRGKRRTVRQIYLCLKAAYQAAPDRKACLRIQDKLLTSQIHGMDIEKFNLKWSLTLTTLRNYGYDIPWDTLILKYISKLPSGCKTWVEIGLRNNEIVTLEGVPKGSREVPKA
ncbi:hypothetical protein EV359DRAFT_87137 [Lentinula novae-zelandiae]|nr:hypothetical protein EV359DRAFT_87137 [Lentinula novae-zelandiae]